MRRWINCGLLLAFLIAPVRAQEPASGEAAETWTKERIESPPTRQIKFERREEELTRFKTQPNPSLDKLQWAASLTLVFPPSDYRYVFDTVPTELRERPIGQWTMLYVLGRTVEMQSVGERKTGGWPAAFQDLVERMPAERRPSEGVVKLFTGEEIALRFHDGQRSGISNPRQLRELSLQLWATSPEEAEQMAGGLLTMLDWGVSRTAQLQLWQQLEKTKAEVVRLQQVVAEQTKDVDTLTADAAEQRALRTETGRTALASLRVELLVERSGARARIAACDKLVAAGRLSAGRQEQIEKERVAAEIQLASLDARLQSIQAAYSLDQSKRQLQGEESGIAALQNGLEYFAPPKLENNTVLIQPLVWKQR
jgi:hypothetical protein